MAVKSPPGRPTARQPRPSQSVRPHRPRPPRNNERFAHDMWGLGLVALGLILLVSLMLGHHAGLLGHALVSGLRQMVGIGAWVFPLVLAAVGIMLITGREQHTRANFAGGAALLFVIGIAWWHLGHTTRETEFTDITQGGWTGAALSGGLRALLGDVSSHIFLLLFTIGGIVWATDMRLLHLFDHAVASGRRVTGPLTESARAGAAVVKDRTQARKEASAALKSAGAEKSNTAVPSAETATRL